MLNLSGSLRPLGVLLTLAFAGLSAVPLHAAVIVTQTDKGFQFTDAVSINVNGKDKVLSLGAQPKGDSANGKYPSVKLEAALLRDRATSLFAVSTDAGLEYVIPEGLAKGTQPDAVKAWSDARIGYKAPDKTQADISPASFVAFLPGDLPSLVNLAKSESSVRLIDSSDKTTFETQLSLISAIVKAYPKDPAASALQQYVESAMRSRYERFQGGLANTEVLNQALKYKDLSQSLFPDLPEHVKLREQIGQLKIWLDRKVAVLRAFASGEAWDQFVIADSDFDQYESSFPDLAKLRTQALQKSLESHRKAGEELASEREYGAAYRQFRLASMRQPSDRVLAQQVTSSWANYSREVALDKQSERKQLSVGEREILNQAIQFATNYKNENKLDLALNSITQGEAVDPNSLPLLLKKAEVLGARSEFAKAFAALDQYDLRAVDEERTTASSLRNDLLFKQTSTLEDVKDQMKKAVADGKFVQLHELALKGLRASDNDPDLLYQAATAFIISREKQKSRELFMRYLSTTNTLDANPDQRNKVRSLLASITNESAMAESGTRNWLSGKKLPDNVFYCPISLAFQPKIDHIDASGKMKVAYEWNGDQLLSITPTFEKAEKNTGERKTNFAYGDKFPQVIAVSEGDARPAPPSSSDPDDQLRHSAVVILNNPYIDPDAVEKLTGRNVSLVMTGNRFFEPFVWDRVHFFRLNYDSFGRVAHAVELADASGALSGFSLDFEWDGQHLMAVRGYQGADPAHRSQVYERTMEYQGGDLVAEDISSSGKRAHIKYNYNGSRLASAQCSNDASLDDRSRQVTFR